jgi:probable rRNA maturation factor
MLRVDITAQDAAPDASLRRTIKHAAKAAARAERLTGRIRVCVLVTGDDAIRTLNRQFRDKDKATDVLSFPSDDDGFLGDIAISLPRAQAQAEEYGHTLRREAAFLTVHAMLHLMGYDHENPDDEARMRRRQREIMDKAGISR